MQQLAGSWHRLILPGQEQVRHCSKELKQGSIPQPVPRLEACPGLSGCKGGLGVQFPSCEGQQGYARGVKPLPAQSCSA